MRRRQFVRNGTLALSSVPFIASGVRAKTSANDRITVAVVGVRGRGSGLLHAFADNDEVNLKYVCDLDPGVLRERTEKVSEKLDRRPQEIADFRRALDDPEIDAIVLGTPDHWHALPSILACQAGKDVYVEKPDGHNILEGETMVAAAKKYGRVVQLGTQGRSGEHQLAAIQYASEGHLGKVRFAKAWESAKQGNIGHPPDGDPPEGVDYDTWLGPAPKRAFNPMRFHSNWRWFFDYGAGDLGNDGVHRLDLALWLLETALVAQDEEPLAYAPRAASAFGGKQYFDDDQEWPDNLMVTYDFSRVVMTYEMRIWTPYQYYGGTEGALVYGDEGYLVLRNRDWAAFDPDDKRVAGGASEQNTTGHVQNFLDCMRTREKPVADLETIGHRCSLLCHIGNAAWRVGRSVEYDLEARAFKGDKEATGFVTRPEYRAPWLLPEISKL